MVIFASFAFVCPRCGKPIAVSAVFERQMDEQSANHVLTDALARYLPIQSMGIRVASVWPEMEEPNIPEYLPEQVMRPLLQAERVFAMDHMEENAAASYGRALEMALKTIDNSPKISLAKRIRVLAETHQLTPELADWADGIRHLRNDAVHDVGDISRAELISLRGITEMIMRYLFTLPAMVAAMRRTAESAPDQ
jgi:hypothetical protein